MRAHDTLEVGIVGSEKRRTKDKLENYFRVTSARLWLTLLQRTTPSAKV